MDVVRLIQNQAAGVKAMQVKLVIAELINKFFTSYTLTEEIIVSKVSYNYRKSERTNLS